MKKLIWIVDDDPIFQIIMRKIIVKSEIFSSFHIFQNGNEALLELNKALEFNEILPDIILLDINMPIMNGWEFMEEIVQIESPVVKKIDIYIVSSSVAIEDKNRAKTYPNVLGFISKPITVNDLQLIASSS